MKSTRQILNSVFPQPQIMKSDKHPPLKWGSDNQEFQFMTFLQYLLSMNIP
jgi:hypothetical protein